MRTNDRGSRCPLLLLWIAALAGCGGSGGGAPEDPPLELVAPSVLAFTGFGNSAGAVGSSTPVVGDSVTNFVRRGYVRFDLGTLPPGAEVVGATLRIWQTVVVGDPYGKFGPLHAEHVDFGATLDAADHDSAAITADLGVLSTSPAPGFVTLEAGSAVAADLAAGRTTSDFRLFFNGVPSLDGIEDAAHFETAGLGHDPSLLILYRLP